MTGGEDGKQKLLTDDALSGAIAAYLADPSTRVAVKFGKGSIDGAVAVPGTPFSLNVLGREDASTSSGVRP